MDNSDISDSSDGSDCNDSSDSSEVRDSSDGRSLFEIIGKSHYQGQKRTQRLRCAVL